ncbi:nuclear transport factor 2 family protein [Asanoa ferruginea]|nr:nuclear transport factor 2 family protein [Asanoa ferruginea]
MAEQTPPAPIAAMIEATNAADSAAFVAAFTDDAYVRDGSREFTGHNGVADWDRTDNIGVGMQFEVLSTEPAGDDAYVVTIRATSRRFNGTGPMRVTLRDGLISRLEIG